MENKNSKKMIVSASKSVNVSKYFDDKNYHEYFSKTEKTKNSGLLLELGRYLGEKLLFSRSVTVTAKDLETMRKAVKIKDQSKRREILLGIGWKYVTKDGLATDTESCNLGMFKKARNRDIVCTILNNIEGCNSKQY